MKPLSIALLLAAAFALAADLPLVQPKDVAARLATKDAPTILYVGPNVLYRSKHIPGSIYGGMAARPEGMESLKAVAGKLPRDRELVIYCGCCPWDKCPNIKPAIEELKRMGFSKVKALYLGTGFGKDWVDAGYPFEPREAGK
jgi:thiosulfate/3-mercaptopyruvate sulfurtransferase